MEKGIAGRFLCIFTLIVINFSLSCLSQAQTHGYRKKGLSQRTTSSVSSSGSDISGNFSGKGTAWGASWTGGNCLFDHWPQPNNLGLVAMASNHWNNSGTCGACLSVTGPGGNSIGIVMDQCPSCTKDSLDLDTAAYWAKVSGGKSPGIIDLSWKIVPCNFEKPMVLINKSGVSQYWTSIQVAGSNVPVSKLELSINGGKTWVTMIRDTNSNHFQYNNQGLGAKGDIRVTCINGKQVLTKGVDLTIAETPINAAGNC